MCSPDDAVWAAHCLFIDPGGHTGPPLRGWSMVLHGRLMGTDGKSAGQEAGQGPEASSAGGWIFKEGAIVSPLPPPFAAKGLAPPRLKRRFSCHFFLAAQKEVKPSPGNSTAMGSSERTTLQTGMAAARFFTIPSQVAIQRWAVPARGNGLPRPEGLAMTTTGSLYGVGSFSSFRPSSVVIARSPQGRRGNPRPLAVPIWTAVPARGRMISAPTGVCESASGRNGQVHSLRRCTMVPAAGGHTGPPLRVGGSSGTPTPTHYPCHCDARPQASVRRPTAEGGS